MAIHFGMWSGRKKDFRPLCGDGGKAPICALTYERFEAEYRKGEGCALCLRPVLTLRAGGGLSGVEEENLSILESRKLSK